jgi:hypothetical protein
MRQDLLFEIEPMSRLENELDLRVLIFSNPLVVDKIGKSFLYWKDSGFIFTKNLISALPRNYRFYWIIPHTIADRTWFTEANENVEIIHYPYSTSIHQNRYEFYGNILKEAFPYTKDIDVIINNQPEVSESLRVWAQNQRRDNPIILSFYHWIDCEESREFAKQLGGYYLRQYEGALASSKIYFHQEYAHELFVQQFNIDFGADIREFNYGYFHPEPTMFGKKPIDLPNKKIILFNHRLNRTTNWKAVLKSVEKLDRDDFVLWMTDDSQMQYNKILERPYIINKSVPSESYGYLIENSRFGICNHSGYSTWNMALLDAYANGCFMTVPDEPSYRYMFGDDFEYYQDTTSDITDLLNKLLDMPKEELEIIRVKTIEKSPCFRNNDTIESDINGFISMQSKPAKYEKVKELIDKSNGITKREIVNELWSFHVNSNFQKIRWLLLLDGYRDDTRSSETVYYKG